jgi:hypothetical protein
MKTMYDTILANLAQGVRDSINKTYKNMTEKTINISVPEGYEIDKDKSTFEKIVFKPTNKKLPKTWEEMNLMYGFFVDAQARVHTALYGDCFSNTWPTKEEAVASIALAQLCQLRDRYNDGWKPDWGSKETKHILYYRRNELIKSIHFETQVILAFKTIGLRDEFLSNFRDLIEKAKPLL